MSAAPPLSENQGRWNIIYPIYMDSTKKISEGRKISLAQAVAAPTLQEIVELCKYLKLSFKIENKCYSRDFFQVGRIRVCIKNDDGTPIIPSIKNRQDLLIEIASKIPKLKSRLEAASAVQTEAAKKSKKNKKGKK